MDTGTAMRSLIPKLYQLFSDKYSMPKAARSQVEFLVRELKLVVDSIERFAELPPEMVDKHVRILVRELREVSYDIEDIIDTFIVGADGSREPINTGGWLKRATKKMSDLPNKGRARGDFVAAIEDMKNQVVEIYERRLRLIVSPITAASTTVDPRLPALYRNERELVGIEEAREELVRLLAQGDEEDDKKRELKVVSVVGLGGVGKTTLAKAVYNRLQSQFDCSAFVSVSRNPDMKKVCMDILLELDEAKYHTVITAMQMEKRQLLEEIRVFLENKRYLIVIDDIWSVRDWKTISAALDNGGNGSRIITTSRTSDVTGMGRGATTYRVKPLSHVNSEKLFYKRIRLAEVSDKILKKCGGLPLAIITVASVLASKPWEEWPEVHNSIALRHEGNRYVHNMRRVLSFSFYDLPLHLRACLFHLSIFPENCLIEKDFLIWMWVAEGLVHEEQEMSLFEFGESCFNDLVNRSTIQIAEERLNKGRIHGCRVHPVLFSQIRAISSEENICTVLEDDEHHTSPGSNSSRRLALHSSSIRNVGHNIVPEANISIEKVRSFNASLCFIDGIPQLSSFQVLRVLALEYCPGMNSHHHLKQIGKLVHLRYLGLVGAGVLDLPEEALAGLRLLQTLDLRETEIEQWPSIISKLQKLMCLCVGRTRTVPEGMGSLRSLEDLRLHHVSGESVGNLTAELGRLERLRVLVLGFEKMDVELEKALLESLRKHPKIKRLEIYCKSSTRAIKWEDSRWVAPPDLRQLVLGGLLFSRLPSWINLQSVPKLSHLQLGVEVLEDGDLETLGRFPKLCSLMLMAAAREQEHHIATVVGSSDHAFNILSFFSTNMVVRFENGLGGPPMPNLEHVELRVRVAQSADDYWLSSLANLKSLEKVTVALDCRGASAAETEEAEKTLMSRVTGIHPTRRLKLEVAKENGNEEVLVEQFRFKNPRFEALRSEMEKMQGNRQVQVQDDNDSDEEITPT